MNAKNPKQVIIELWEQTGKHSAGTAELDLIQQALLARDGTGASESPASIARTLADQGVRLDHPEVLKADVRWRERHQLFTPADLDFGTLDAAIAFIEKTESLRHRFEEENSMFEHLRYSVRQIKSELELVGAAEKASAKSRQLAGEVAQWLTVWLQTPQIFNEWLDLRRSTAEFKERFDQ